VGVLRFMTALELLSLFGSLGFLKIAVKLSH